MVFAECTMRVYVIIAFAAGTVADAGRRVIVAALLMSNGEGCVIMSVGWCGADLNEMKDLVAAEDMLVDL